MKNLDHSNSCQYCLWADQCGCDEPCEHFSPVDEDAVAVADYTSGVKSDIDFYLYGEVL